MTATAQRFREFNMPDVGEGLTEAEILKWHVKPGDTVTDGQLVVEVETAKAAVELPIPYDGTVHELHFEEGATVDVGTSIITVDTDPSAGTPAPAPGAGGTGAGARNGGETADAGAVAETEGDGEGGGQRRKAVLVGYGVSAGATKRRPRKVPGSANAQPGADAGVGGPAEPANIAGQGAVAGLQAPARPAQADAGGTAVAGGVGRTASPGGTGPQGRAPAAATAALQREANGGLAPDIPAPAAPAGGRPLAKPPVRKLAKDMGIDLATITPSGPDGIISRDDVHAAAAPAPREEVAETPAARLSAPAVEPQSLTAIRERRVPIRGVRKATAQAMVGSAFTAPHVTEFVTVDVTRTMKLVGRLKEDPDMRGLRVNPLLLVVKALLVAIRRNPEVNATWDEANQEIVYKDYVNLGIAAATPRGLIVPNIKDAGAKTLPELSQALSELIATAREGKTSPAAMRGGTVTITNVGVFGVDTGTPILNPGESAILAFGAVREQPWVHKGKVKPRQVTTLALSFDHRLVDGALGSKVLADVAAVLEDPKRLITWS